MFQTDSEMYQLNLGNVLNPVNIFMSRAQNRISIKLGSTIPHIPQATKGPFLIAQLETIRYCISVLGILV